MSSRTEARKAYDDAMEVLATFIEYRAVALKARESGYVGTELLYNVIYKLEHRALDQTKEAWREYALAFAKEEA